MKTSKLLGAFRAVGTSVLLIGILPADDGTIAGFTGSSFGADGGTKCHGEREIVLSGDSAAIGELQVVLDLDGVGEAAVFVGDFLMGFNNGVVPGVAAFLGGGDGFQTGGQAFNVVIGSARAGLAESGITELTGQFGGVAQDDGIVGLFRGPVDQSRSRTPEGVGGIFLNTLDLSVVQIIVFVAVQRDFGQEIIPAGDVQSPPCGVDVIFSLIITSRLGVVHHGHGQEIQTEEFLFSVHGDVTKAGFLVFSYVCDGDVGTIFVVQGSVIFAILVVAQGHDLELRLIRNVRGINVSERADN